MISFQIILKVSWQISIVPSNDGSLLSLSSSNIPSGILSAYSSTSVSKNLFLSSIKEFEQMSLLKIKKDLQEYIFRISVIYSNSLNFD